MKSVLLILLAAVCFGTTGTAGALGPADAGSVSVGATRIVIGGAALGLIALWQWRRRSAEAGGRHSGAATARAHGWPAPSGIREALTARSLVGPAIVVVGALSVVAYQLCFFVGTRGNGVAVGTIVALGSAPVITGLLSWLLDRRFPGRVWSIATALASIGVVLISGVLGAGSGGLDVLAILASLGAGASYAVYALASKKLLQRGFSGSGAMGGIFGVAAVFSVPLMLGSDLAWLATPEGLVMALWLGLVTTTLAYLLFAAGLKSLTAPTVATLTLAEPLTASLLGLTVLGEQLSLTAWVGIGVLLAGLVVLVLPARAKPPVAVVQRVQEAV